MWKKEIKIDQEFNWGWRVRGNFHSVFQKTRKMTLEGFAEAEKKTSNYFKPITRKTASWGEVSYEQLQYFQLFNQDYSKADIAFGRWLIYFNKNESLSLLLWYFCTIKMSFCRWYPWHMQENQTYYTEQTVGKKVEKWRETNICEVN